MSGRIVNKEWPSESPDSNGKQITVIMMEVFYVRK